MLNPMDDITRDDLTQFKSSAFVTFGETMLRETPADLMRPEMTREVHLSLGGTEYSIAVLMGRLGIPTSYITRIPDNPYGWMLRDTARANGVNTDHIVWASKAEPMGRYMYEPGRTPRPGVVWYQRMYSAASRLDRGMVDWASALRECRIFHTSGITFGLAAHSNYDKNYLLEAFNEAVQHKPESALVGIDFNYRSTLWSEDQCTSAMTPILEQHTDILVTSIYDMARHYGIGCGGYSAAQVMGGEASIISDDDLWSFGEMVIRRFQLRAVVITLRRLQSFDEHLWESAVITSDGKFARSQAARPITLQDRVGGGDAYVGGFYYGWLTGDLAKAIRVGDAAARLKQTLMFDLPIINKAEVQALIDADDAGKSTHTIR